VIKAPATGVQTVETVPIAARGARLLKAAEALAAAQAAQRVAAAEAKAQAIVAEAEQAARAVRESARDVGRREGAADLAAAWIKLRTEEQQKEEREIDRTLAMATAMAERLLGETLVLDPAKVVGIARQVLDAARQARRVALKAHPEDAAVLRAEIARIGLEGTAIEIHVEPARARGSLLLETDLGTLDADLTLQLDRLARSLRDSLRTG
jgi:type III secretion protein L